MAEAVIRFPREEPGPSQDNRPRRHRFSKRINWERTVIFLCLAYLATFMAWGEITDLRLQSEANHLRQAVKAENASNQALRAAIRALSQKGGENAAVQSQLGLVPKGQVRVIVESGPSNPR